MTGTVVWSNSAGWSVPSNDTVLSAFMTIPPLFAPSGSPLTIFASVIFESSDSFDGFGQYNRGWTTWGSNALNQRPLAIYCDNLHVNSTPRRSTEGWYTGAEVSAGGSLDLHISTGGTLHPAQGLLVVFVIDFGFGSGYAANAVDGGINTTTTGPTSGPLQTSLLYKTGPLISWCRLFLVDQTDPLFSISDPNVVIQGSGTFSANGAVYAYVYFVSPYANPAGLYGQPTFPAAPVFINVSWAWTGATVIAAEDSLIWYSNTAAVTAVSKSFAHIIG